MGLRNETCPPCSPLESIPKRCRVAACSRLEGNTLQVRFALLHSPVVGPSTWRWVAEALRNADHEVIVPDLVAAAISGNPLTYAHAAIAAYDTDDVVLVGHSGAGAILPLVAHGSTHAPRLTVFVDAGLPPCEGSFTAGGDFIARMRELAINGVLPRWSRWWRAGLLETLVPDVDRREAIEHELPEIPIRFYETSIDVPEGWCAGPGAYVLLSEGYRPDADRALKLGWPVVERPGRHLDIANNGNAIADLLIELGDRP